MKYLLLMGLLPLFIGVTFCQKLEGTYVGKIISERNALVLEKDKDHLVKGALYVTAENHFELKGSYVKSQLKGFIALASGRKISIKGDLKGSSLSIEFSDGTGTDLFTIHKISTSVSMDMKGLFSEEHDMLLLGKWTACRRVDVQGNDITESEIATYEYNPYGAGKFRLSGPISSTLRPENTRWELVWETHDGLLTEVAQHPLAGEVTRTDEFMIRNDTLALKNRKNGKTTYLKRAR